MAEKWIQGAIKHPGAFTRKAKTAGMSVAGYARKVTKKGSTASTQTKRQANLAKTLTKISKGQGGGMPFSNEEKLAAMGRRFGTANLQSPVYKEAVAFKRAKAEYEKGRQRPSAS